MSGSRTTDMRTLAIVALLSCGLVLARPASAGTEPESPDSLIDRGLDLRRQGKPAEALELFERANSMAPSARAIAQMGLAEISLHRWIDADAHITAALARHDSEWIENPKTRETLRKALSDIGTHLGRIRVEGTNGAEITMEGRMVGRLPLPAAAAVNPGAIRIRATAPGHQPLDVEVVVAAGEEIVTKTDLVPFPDAAPPLTPQTTSTGAPVLPSEEHHWRQWTGATLVGVGVASVTAGVVWLSINGKGTCDPVPGGTCQRSYDTSLQGWLALGAGAALAGAGVGLLVWRGHDEQISLGFGPSSFTVTGRF
jgi:hypothetical protein